MARRGVVHPVKFFVKEAEKKKKVKYLSRMITSDSVPFAMESTGRLGMRRIASSKRSDSVNGRPNPDPKVEESRLCRYQAHIAAILVTSNGMMIRRSRTCR